MEPSKGKTTNMSKFEDVSTKQGRIAKLAKEAPDMAMNLSHHMDLNWFIEAYHKTRKDGAVGVDGQTAKDYEENLLENLQSLLDRAKSGSYRAPAVRRVHIPKDAKGKETRPIGIPTFEDKVLQRAVVMALEPVYEQDFLDCSYGFRPSGPGTPGIPRDTSWLQPQITSNSLIRIEASSHFPSSVLLPFIHHPAKVQLN